MTSRALVVIPTYNELNNLPRLVEQLLGLPEKVDILVVDDNSPDGTGAWVLEEAKKRTRLHLLSRKEKNGLGRAYIAGFQWALQAGYEFIVQMDADFSHNPDDVPKLLAAIQNEKSTGATPPCAPAVELSLQKRPLVELAAGDAGQEASGAQRGSVHEVLDRVSTGATPPCASAVELYKRCGLTIGSRYVNGVRVINWPLRRLILSVGASYYVHAITGLPIHDPTGGFKCWRRATLEAIEIEKVKSNGYGFQIEMSHRAWRKGFSIVEVPIIFTDRFQGTSKMSWHIVLEAFFMVWQLLIQSHFRKNLKKNENS